MADYQLSASNLGVYEIQLSSGNPTTVAVETDLDLLPNAIQVNVHDAASPVYVRFGTTVSIKDPAASVVNAGTWLTLPGQYGATNTIALISASAATVSVTRA